MQNLSRRELSLASLAVLAPFAARGQEGLRLWPANGATGVNPDTLLVIAFPRPVEVGTSGLIRIFDASDNSLVDALDMSIPAGPNWRARRPAGSPPDTTVYQSYTIGGYEGFRAHPVIVHGRIATIYPHHHKLRYGRRYIVRLDPGVLNPGGAIEWSFTTRRNPPAAGLARYVVAADGSGDFNTVQGAIDFMPPAPPRPVTILIRRGNYEELVYARGKSNLIIRGEDRDQVTVGYGNNSAFNVTTPRHAFTLSGCDDVQLSTFTIRNYYFGQAEALRASGQRIVIDRMTLDGSGDAVQIGGTLYFTRSRIRGDGDTLLTTAAAFFDRCEVHSLGPVIWPRNTAANRGLVFSRSKFFAIREPLPWTRTPEGGGQISNPTLARLPDNGGINYPYGEVVLLNCELNGYSPEAWGPVQAEPAFPWANVYFWEYNTLQDGRPADMSRRHPVVRELKLPQDREIIANYSNPAWVLGGWRPVVR